MYVILSYDVEVKRDVKVCNMCRRYLLHAHESLFEGVISEAKLRELERSLEELVDVRSDSIRVYRFPSVRYARKDEIGISRGNEAIV